MALPPCDDVMKGKIAELRQAGLNKTQVATRLGISRGSVHRYWGWRLPSASPAENTAQPRDTSRHFATLPEPAPEAGGPSLPEPIYKPLVPFEVDTPGWWGVLGDVHLPMHDKGTIQAFVAECKANSAVGVLLNGDLMDMFGISPFFRIPTKDRFVDEIETVRHFLAWIREQLPKARFIFREGNHEFRFTRYVAERAPALFDLPECTLQSLLELKKYGVEWVQDKRKVMLGKLTTLHGHEFRKGEGINPARLAFLRATATVLVGHHHRTSEHHQRTLDDKALAAWSVGCACFTSPEYDPYNQWNHGYAMIELARDGWFSVHNRRVINGRTV